MSEITVCVLCKLTSVVFFKVSYSLSLDKAVLSHSISGIVNCIALNTNWTCRCFSFRRRPWRQEVIFAGVCSHWWLWNKEVASSSAAWRLSWRHSWRVWLPSTPQVNFPQQSKQRFFSTYKLEIIFWSLFSFADVDLEQRHMAFCSLFSDALALLNGVGVSAGEALAARVINWLDRKGRGFPILPLLTACSRCLASVRHMTRIMEACITAHFNHGE